MWLLENAPRPPTELTAEEIEPCQRIADTILLYAVKDGATCVCWEPSEKGIVVFYEVQGEWIEQMKLPRYVQEPVEDALRAYSVYETLEGKRYNVQTTAMATHYGNRLLIQLQSVDANLA